MTVFALSVSGNPGLSWLIAALFQPHLRGIEHQYTSSPVLRLRQSRPTTELDELILWMLTTIKSSQSNSLKHFILSRHPHCLCRGLTTSNAFTLNQAFYFAIITHQTQWGWATFVPAGTTDELSWRLEKWKAAQVAQLINERYDTILVMGSIISFLPLC